MVPEYASGTYISPFSQSLTQLSRAYSGSLYPWGGKVGCFLSATHRDRDMLKK